MSHYKIRIPFTPKPKSTVRIGGKGWYNPSAKGMAQTRAHVKSQLPEDHQPLRGPLLVVCHFRMPVPRSVPGSRRRAQHTTPHVQRPDRDNLEKFLNDSLNGLLWRDDSQIAWLLCTKTNTQAKEGETVLYVQELSTTVPNYEEIMQVIKNHIVIED